MAPDETESVGSSESREITGPAVDPPVAGARKDGLKSILVPEPWQTTVRTDSIEMDSVHHQAVYPDRFLQSASHGLLRQLAKGISVLASDPCRDRKGSLYFGVVGGQQDAPVRLHGQNPIAGTEVKPLRHVLWQSGPDGASNLSQSQFAGHQTSRILVNTDPNTIAQKCYLRKLHLKSATPRMAFGPESVLDMDTLLKNAAFSISLLRVEHQIDKVCHKIEERPEKTNPL